MTLSALSQGSAPVLGASYEWNQTFGTPATVESRTSYSITFVAPTPPRSDPITLIFEVEAQPVITNEQRDTVMVIVSPDAPSQDAILFSVVDGETDDSVADEDDEPDPNSSSGTNDDGSNPSNDSVGNDAPIANAGGDQTAQPEMLVSLDGSASFDPEYSPLTYAWSQISGAPADLFNSKTSMAWFVAPVADDGTELVFRLDVCDGQLSDDDEVTIQLYTPQEADSEGPSADAGPDIITFEEGIVTLNGSDSQGSGPEALTFNWIQISGATVELSSPDQAVTTFVAPAVDGDSITLVFDLLVSQAGLLDIDEMVVAVLDEAQQGGDEVGEVLEGGEDETDWEQDPPVPAGTNVALNRGATYTLAPEYSSTTGPSDPTDLTDGVIYVGTKKLWTRQEAVGWNYPLEPLGIQIDLGDDYPIETISFDTAGGSAGVYIPGAALAYVSDDGLSWHYAASLLVEAVPQNAYVQHQYVKSGLHTSGRYVALYVVASGPFIFCDEIEVLTGAFNPVDVIFEDAAVATDLLGDDTMARFPLAVENTVSVYFIGSAATAIASVPGGDLAGVTLQLDSINTAVLNNTDDHGVDRRNGLPYTPLDYATCWVVGGYMAGAGLPEVTVWEFTALDHPMLPFERPTTTESPDLAANMMVNEHEHAGFCVSNNRAETKTVSLMVTGPSDGPTVGFREGFYVLAPGYQLIGDALLKIEGGVLEIPCGMTKEVWLDLDSAGVSPGVYEYNVAVVVSGQNQADVPVTVEVFAPVMPDNPQYLTTPFAYYNDGIAVDKAAWNEDLSEHYANVQALNTNEVPDPKFIQGEPVQPVVLDFSTLDAVIDLRTNVSFWLLNIDADETTLELLLEGGTAEDEQVYKDWVTAIRDHFADKGISTDQWAFLWIDEPTLDQYTDYILPLAAWTRELDPNVQICVDWNKTEVEEQILATQDLADIYVPTHSRVSSNSAEILPFIVDQGAIGWKYDSTSSLARNPYTDYRLTHWSAWDWGLTGNAKWVYYDDDDDAWNDNFGTIQTMAYPGDDGAIIPSKRWEAWRDGIEDYELMRLLAEEVEATGDPDLTALLTDAPGTVLDDTDNPTILEALRLAILQGLND